MVASTPAKRSKIKIKIKIKIKTKEMEGYSSSLMRTVGGVAGSVFSSSAMSS